MITLDGCRYDIAIQQMGDLNHFVEKKLASRFKVLSETPIILGRYMKFY